MATYTGTAGRGGNNGWLDKKASNNIKYMHGVVPPTKKSLFTPSQDNAISKYP
jgi:hypothetical protein